MKKNLAYLLLLLTSLLPLAAKAATLTPFVDLLAWNAVETNTSWAVTLEPIANTSDITSNTINFNTRLGLKTGFSYTPTGNFWDSKFYWTYFPSSSSQTVTTGDKLVTSLFFSGSYFISGDAFFGGSINWQLVMNTLDLEISHGFKPTPILTLTPKMGVKAASINQDIKVSWDALVYIASEVTTTNYSGLGPSFGLGGKLDLTPHFSLIGDVSTALMYGNWNIKDGYNRPSALAGIIPAQNITTSMNQAKLGTMMMDYFLGLQWVHQGQSRVTIKLGYEMQYWANQLRLIAIQQLPTLGDLTIQGGTCGIYIDL